jgi:hypothetical protein
MKFLLMECFFSPLLFITSVKISPSERWPHSKATPKLRKGHEFCAVVRLAGSTLRVESSNLSLFIHSRGSATERWRFSVVFRRCLLRISAGRASIMMVDFHSLPHSLHEIARLLHKNYRSQWPHGLKQEPSSHAVALGSWVRIPLEVWMCVFVYSVFVLFCV